VKNWHNSQGNEGIKSGKKERIPFLILGSETKEKKERKKTESSRHIFQTRAK